MKKKLNIALLLFLISYSTIYSQNSDFKISQACKRIENSKTLKMDSLSLKRGIDFSRGSNVDEKIYRIFKKGNRIVKIEFDERNDGYRKWQQKTIIYLKNDVPFFIIEKNNGIITYYTSNGEEAAPYKNLEEIYIYNWNKEHYKRVTNGNNSIPQMQVCKVCYEELIARVKKEMKNKKIN